jgi:hypothetical protein
MWFDGDGPPANPYPGANDGDLYLDNLTGDYYRLTGQTFMSLVPVNQATQATSFVPVNQG